MRPPKVFIGSSSEGLEVAKTVRNLLLQELRDQVEVTPWTRAFDLSATYIESLEKAAAEADFAIMVITPDDVTTSREQKKLAPRDNVIFELGLFMGSLGRERCFIVNEAKQGLKLPSDLLGVHTAAFKRSSDADLRVALDPHSIFISDRIAKLGTRYKLSKDALASSAAICEFRKLVEGTWWERIDSGDANVLSFFRIEPDTLFNSVSLVGKSYDEKGLHVTNWKSVIGRLDKDANKILYHWQGWYVRTKHSNLPFHGFGEMEFDKPTVSGDVISRGTGKFWDVDEAHPERTKVKPVQLRRILEPNAISTMTSGREKAISSLIKKTLRGW